MFHETETDIRGSEKFCGYCGERLPDLGDGLTGGCPTCRRAFGRSRARRAAPPPIPREAAMRFGADAGFGSESLRDPVLACLLSTVIPGAGQVYNGQFFKGLLVFLTCWLIIPYFLGIFDAYVTAEGRSRHAVDAWRR
jgi:hypothetical protein